MIQQLNAELKGLSLFVILFWSKNFCIRSTDTKKPISIPTIFLSLFSHPQKHTIPTILMDAKQYALTLFLFLLFGPYVFYSLHTTLPSHHHCNNFTCSYITNQSGTCNNDHGSSSTALSHISFVLK